MLSKLPTLLCWLARVLGLATPLVSLTLLTGLVPGAAYAVYFDLQVEPTESRLELASGQLDLVLAPGWTVALPVQPQLGEPGTVPVTLPGGGQSDGLETSLYGLVLAEIDAPPSQLDLSPTATEFTAGSSGTWAPASGGGGGVGFAAAAFLVEDGLLGIDFVGALRDVEGSLQSSLVLTPDGPDAWIATGSLDLHLTEGVLDYDSILPGLSGSGPLLTGGPAIASASVTNGRYEIVGGVGRLSLPFTTDPFVLFASDIGGALPVSLTATLQGTLVAYELPEPSTGTGLLFGVGALSLMARRRARRRPGGPRAPIPPWTRVTLQCGVLALLLLGLVESGCVDVDTGNVVCDLSPDTYTALTDWSETLAGQPQCGTVSVDTDGSDPPEGSDSSCVTPGDDTAPGILASVLVPAPGGDAIVESSVTKTGRVMQAVCRHDLAAALAPGATQCTAAARRSVSATVDPAVSIGTTVSFFVSARRAALGPGAGDAFAAEVVVQCPGETPQAVPLTGESTAISFDYQGSSPIVCEVEADITQSSTAAAGQTAHELLFQIDLCPLGPTGGFCDSDWGCTGSCVGNQCSTGNAGESCLDASDCDASAPICYVDFTCRSGSLGSPCQVKRHCAAGLECDAGVCSDPPPPSTITIDLATVTPDLNRLGGVRPRFTPAIDLTAVVETDEPMSQLTATTVACDPAKVSSCTPVSDGPAPPATAWSVDLPDYQSAPSGELYQIDVSVEDASGVPGQASDQVDFEIYPEDVGASITCTKSYDSMSGDLSLGFTVTPPPSDFVLNASYFLYQRYEAEGWTPDESDSFLNQFLLMNPTTLTPVDDGEYQLIFVGEAVVGSNSTPFQTSLRIDTLGGPNDVCTPVP